MADITGFDATNVEPNAPMKPVPAGDYVVVIEKSEKKATKDGNGAYIEFVLQIVDGEHKGRRLWDRLNLWNQNKQAVEIAQKTLSAICRSVGVMKPEDTQNLHGKPLVATVACSKSNTGNIQNDVKGYAAHGGGSYSETVAPQQPPQGGTQQQQQPPNINTATGDAPWQS